MWILTILIDVNKVKIFNSFGLFSSANKNIQHSKSKQNYSNISREGENKKKKKSK